MKSNKKAAAFKLETKNSCLKKNTIILKRETLVDYPAFIGVWSFVRACALMRFRRSSPSFLSLADLLFLALWLFFLSISGFITSNHQRTLQNSLSVLDIEASLILGWKGNAALATRHFPTVETI